MNKESKHVIAYSLLLIIGVFLTFLKQPIFSPYLGLIAFSLSSHELAHYVAIRLMRHPTVPMSITSMQAGWNFSPKNKREASIAWFAPVVLAPAYYLLFTAIFPAGSLLPILATIVWTLVLSLGDVQNFSDFAKGS